MCKHNPENDNLILKQLKIMIHLYLEPRLYNYNKRIYNMVQ